MTSPAQPRPWHRRFLTWLRIEDEHHLLSLTTVAFIVGAACLLSGRAVSWPALAVFALGLAAHEAKRHRAFRLAQQAVDSAHHYAIAEIGHQHELALAAQNETVKGLGEKMEKIERQVKELAEPQRLAAAREAFRPR